MTEVFIAGQRLDLNPNDIIALTKQINDIAEIQRRNADFTNRFTCYKTPNNMAIAEMLNVPGNTSTRPYKWAPAKIVSNGIPVTNAGIALLQETRNANTYEFIIYAGNYDLYSKIADKYITDLDWSDLNHNFEITQLYVQDDREDNYIYPLADTLGGLFNITDAGTTTFDAEYQVPHVFVKTIWQRIFDEADISYYGDFFDSDAFINDLVVADNSEFEENKKYVAIVKNEETEYVNIGGLLNTTPQSVDSSVYLTAEKDDQSMLDSPPYTVVIPRRGVYELTLAIADVSTLICQNLRIRILKNYSTTVEEVTIGTKEQNPAYHQTIDITKRIMCEVGDYFSINVRVETKTVSGYSYEQFQVLLTGVTFTVAYDSKILYGEQIDFSKQLPRVKQIDFLKAIMQKYGLMYQPDTTGAYHFVPIEAVLNGEIGTADMTEKLHDETKEGYRIGSYNKNNKFVYRYYDEDLLGEGYADYSYPIDIDDLGEEGNVVESTIQACGEYTKVNDNVEKLAGIYSYTNNGTVEEPDYKLLSKNILKVVRLQRIELSYHELSINVEGATSVYWGVYSPLSYPFAKFAAQHWPLLVEAYYPAFIKLTQKPIVKNVRMWLTPIDIYFLDLFKIVYFRQYQSYFYINKINNFQAGKLSDCELIKIQ